MDVFALAFSPGNFGSGQVTFRDADQKTYQEGVQKRRYRAALLARTDGGRRNGGHQRDAHAVGPPGEVGQVAVKGDDCGEQVGAECRTATSERRFLGDYRNRYQRSGSGAHGK